MRTRDRDAFTVNIGKVLNIYKVTYQMIRFNLVENGVSGDTSSTEVLSHSYNYKGYQYTM